MIESLDLTPLPLRADEILISQHFLSFYYKAKIASLFKLIFFLNVFISLTIFIKFLIIYY